MKHLLLLGSIVLAGCSSIPDEVYTGSTDCGHIGCATGGLQHFPHERFGATKQPKEWYSWDWGKTSSAFTPGSIQYNELKRQEAIRMRSLGLDPMGRPLYQQ